MPVGEAEHPAVQMAQRGMVHPRPDPRLGDDEPGVLDAALVFVDEDGRPGRRRVLHLGQRVPAGSIPRGRRVVHVGAHRDAPHPGDLPEVTNRRPVRRTLVDLRGAVIGEQNPALDVRGGRVGPRVSRDPGLGGGDPTLAPPAGGRRVGRQVVVEIVDVQQPADLQLAVVAEAGDLGRLRLRARQRGKQHRGEDGDDRDDHQQLDQGEPARRRSRSRPGGRASVDHPGARAHRAAGPWTFECVAVHGPADASSGSPRRTQTPPPDRQARRTRNRQAGSRKKKPRALGGARGRASPVSPAAYSESSSPVGITG